MNSPLNNIVDFLHCLLRPTGDPKLSIRFLSGTSLSNSCIQSPGAIQSEVKLIAISETESVHRQTLMGLRGIAECWSEQLFLLDQGDRRVLVVCIAQNHANHVRRVWIYHECS
jgi:hypothetical protein